MCAVGAVCPIYCIAFYMFFCIAIFVANSVQFPYTSTFYTHVYVITCDEEMVRLCVLQFWALFFSLHVSAACHKHRSPIRLWIHVLPGFKCVVNLRSTCMHIRFYDVYRICIETFFLKKNDRHPLSFECNYPVLNYRLRGELKKERRTFCIRVFVVVASLSIGILCEFYDPG